MPLSQEEYADEEDNVLFQAIKNKDWEQVQELTTKPGNEKLLQEVDCYDNTALHAALGYQAPDEIVLKILDGYPQATKIHGANEWLPLHVAAMWGSSSAVMTELIRNHPEGLDDRGQEGIKGRTPRHFKDRFEHNKALLGRTTDDWICWIKEHPSK